jgi:hypothetical protein
MRMMNVKTRLIDRSRGYKLTESFRKCSIFLIATILILSATLCFRPVALATDGAGNYIVAEYSTNALSMVTPGGVRTAIYYFANPHTYPEGVAIDGAGNYIVAESGAQALSKVTPGGVRTVIYSFAAGTYPTYAAIDSAGNYIVAESGAQALSKVTPGGVRTVIYSFAANTIVAYVAIDGAGNYIVAESGADKLSKVTPGGVRTVIYSFAAGTWPNSVAIDGAGNYIVTEGDDGKLSKVTPGGVRTVIYSFAAGTSLGCVAIDGAGNYIVTESMGDKLSKVTPGGVRTVIYSFAAGTFPSRVAIVPVAIDPSTFDEYFDVISYNPFDSDGDGYNDAIEVEMEIDTTYSGTLRVDAGAYLKDPSGTTVDVGWAGYDITDGATEYGYAQVFVPAGSPEGWYKVSLGLWDQWGNYEDYRIDGFQTYLYPPSMKIDTVVDFSFTPNPVAPGATVTLSGTLKTEGGSPVYPTQVKVEYSTNGGASWNFFGNLNTNAAGQFSVSFSAPGVGTYLVRVSYAGSATYNPSSYTQTLTVQTGGKVNTQIAFAVSPNPASPGATVTLFGTLKDAGSNPVYPTQVKVEYSTNGGATWNYVWTLNTNAAGQFSQSFSAPEVGTYLVRVSYAGSTNYNPSSQTQTLVVQTGVSWTYNFRMSPASDVLRFNLAGSVIYGVAENSVGSYPYSNAPIIGYVDGGSFYLFIDGPDKTPPFWELLMMVGSVSTLKGNVYQTMDGTSWNGPTAYTLVPVASAQSYTSEQASTSSLTVAPQSWPATYHFRINPFVDIVHLSVDGQLIHGICDAVSADIRLAYRRQILHYN